MDNKPTINEVKQIYKVEPTAKWAAVNNPVYGQLLVSLGIKTFNSVHFILI